LKPPTAHQETWNLTFFGKAAVVSAASLTSGTCEKVTVLLALDELERLKGIIREAKARLDEIK